jgi:hypothetical protein
LENFKHNLTLLISIHYRNKSEIWSRRSVSFVREDDQLVDKEKALQNLKVNVSYNRVMPSLASLNDDLVAETTEKFSNLLNSNRKPANTMNMNRSVKASVNWRLARAAQSLDPSKAIKPEPKDIQEHPKIKTEKPPQQLDETEKNLKITLEMAQPIDFPAAVVKPESKEVLEFPKKESKHLTITIEKTKENLEIDQKYAAILSKPIPGANIVKTEEKPLKELNVLESKNPISQPSVQQAKPLTPLREKLPKAGQDQKWKSHVLIPQTRFVVLVTHVTDNSIWVVPKNDYDDLQEYLDMMTQFYVENCEGFGRITPQKCKVGDLLVYPFDEDYFYRAEVLETTPQTKIRLIDFGNDLIFDTEPEVYRALSDEKGKPAFAFEVFPRSPDFIKKIDVDMEISIKIVSDPQDDKKIAKIKFLDGKVVPKNGQETPTKLDEEKISGSLSPLDASWSFTTSASRLMVSSLNSLRKDIKIGKIFTLRILK